MKIDEINSDETILHELGARLTAARLAKNLTQAALAEQAGVGKRTIERLEAGAVATQLVTLVRVCRALKLIDRLDLLVPQVTPSPTELVKLQGRQRQRASTKIKPPNPSKSWTWGDTE